MPIEEQAPQLAESSFHGGWYLPTSGEWYRMLTCQEAVYVTGAQATKSGTKPVLTADKHDTKYVRPFIAF
ncbi:MAG: hypothetical protein IJU13_06585 [Bacteroidales bacterium]|nr:hypothetical protein [Bacteroidales bacterium]